LQVSGQLKGIEEKLKEQQQNSSQIRRVLADLRYLADIETIEAYFLALMEGKIKSMVFILLLYFFAVPKRKHSIYVKDPTTWMSSHPS
jgi:hypothetical protein